uniref:Uncharacterized protein n=1 Tax=Arundo donax TaxID=35708 RepID=A0A0A8Y2Y5_ARUDO
MGSVPCLQMVYYKKSGCRVCTEYILVLSMSFLFCYIKRH